MSRGLSKEYVKSDQESHRMSGVEFAGLMEAVLEKNVPFRFTASGLSMSPFIRDGDVITLEPVTGQLRSGDVVAFRTPCFANLVVHRIIHVSQKGYLIKGDNLVETDLVPASSIIGRVVGIEHQGHQVRLGQGRERFVLAWLSRRGWLRPVSRRACGVLQPLAGKWMTKITF